MFASVQHSETFYCPYTGSCQAGETFGFEWWRIGKSKDVGSISLYGYCLDASCTLTISKIALMDLDKAGNIYFDYYWFNSSSRGSHGSGWGLAEITNPTTTSWSLVQVLAPEAGPWKCPEGIYVSTAADDTQSPQSSSGSGHPLIGGFGLGDKYIAVGDEGNRDGDTWVDYGAALTPSDKPK